MNRLCCAAAGRATAVLVLGLFSRTDAPMGPHRETQRVLAVASGGGHWIQLLRMMAAFDECDVAFVTTLGSYRSQVPDSRFYSVVDGNRWNKLRLFRMALQVVKVLVLERPD